MKRRNADDVNIETIQSPEWLDSCDPVIGSDVPAPIDVLEMGLPHDLKAKVLENGPCPPISNGPGWVVLTTINHLNNDIWELCVEAGGENTSSIRTTGLHRFYSDKRQTWLSARDLTPGEMLVRNRHGSSDHARAPTRN